MRKLVTMLALAASIGTLAACSTGAAVPPAPATVSQSQINHDGGGIPTPP